MSKTVNIEEMTYAGLREALGEIDDKKGPDEEQAALIEAWNARWGEARGKYRWDPARKDTKKKA